MGFAQYILIYSEQTDVDFKYEVSTQDNNATVIIRRAGDNGGYTTIDIQKTGAIYLY